MRKPAIKTNHSEVLDRDFAKFQTVHVGLQKDDNEWLHDKWVVVFNGHNIDYSTGIGHRKLFPRIPKYLAKIANDRMSQVTRAKSIGIDCAKDLLSDWKPIAPNIDDVIYSLISDASAGLELFSDFCDNFGYDEDSRKAFSIYEACQKSTVIAREIGLLKEEIQEAFQDY